jgi:hypothetical protein
MNNQFKNTDINFKKLPLEIQFSELIKNEIEVSTNIAKIWIEKYKHSAHTVNISHRIISKTIKPELIL